MWSVFIAQEHPIWSNSIRLTFKCNYYLILNQNKIIDGTHVFLELELLHHHARRICNARFSLKAAKFSQLKISITNMSLKPSGFRLKKLHLFFEQWGKSRKKCSTFLGFWYMVFLTFHRFSWLLVDQFITFREIDWLCHPILMTPLDLMLVL